MYLRPKKYNNGHCLLEQFVLSMILFVLFFAVVLWSSFISHLLRPELLQRNYSPEQIKTEQLRIIWTRGRIEISNGDILPDDEYQYYISRFNFFFYPFIFLCIVVMVVMELTRKRWLLCLFRFFGQR